MTQIATPMKLSAAIRGDNDADSDSNGAICCDPGR